MESSLGSVVIKRRTCFKYLAIICAFFILYVYRLHVKLNVINQSILPLRKGSTNINVHNAPLLAKIGSYGLFKKGDIKSPGPMKIVVFGYQRGGTTFLGNVLGVREGTFYLYEPLYQLGAFQYLKRGEICSMKDNSCKLSVDFRKATEIIDNIFQCKFRPSDRKILSLWQFRRGQGDTNMTAPAECDGKTEQECFYMQSKRCRESKAIVIKIVRTDMGIMEEILKSHSNLKIVHLIRDPRAIMHSRHKAWYNEYKYTSKSAKSLCVKIKGDFEGSQAIDLKNPGHIYTVFYEDFAKYPLEYTKDIYLFVGYKFNDVDRRRLISMTHAKKTTINPKVARWDTKRQNSSLTAIKWRLTVPLGLFKLTTNMCSDVCDMFGYAKFDSVKLRDLSLPVRET